MDNAIRRDQLVNEIADILGRFPCRAEAGSELDTLRRREVARVIVYEALDRIKDQSHGG